MTEEEWFSTDNVHSVMARSISLSGEDKRKLRLLSCAFARAVLHLCLEKRVVQLLEIAESAIEGEVSEKERASLRRDMSQWYQTLETKQNRCVGSAVYYALSRGALVDTRQAAYATHAGTGYLEAERRRQCDFARDIFGNPFRPVAFDPNWRTSTSVGLAQTMYDARNFNAMPILADALQDAGCEDAAILGHCRDANGLHVRGCWVVDLVLNKS